VAGVGGLTTTGTRGAPGVEEGDPPVGVVTVGVVTVGVVTVGVVTVGVVTVGVVTVGVVTVGVVTGDGTGLAGQLYPKPGHVNCEKYTPRTITKIVAKAPNIITPIITLLSLPAIYIL